VSVSAPLFDSLTAKQIPMRQLQAGDPTSNAALRRAPSAHVYTVKKAVVPSNAADPGKWLPENLVP
jgi:hypothetical protein